MHVENEMFKVIMLPHNMKVNILDIIDMII